MAALMAPIVRSDCHSSLRLLASAGWDACRFVMYVSNGPEAGQILRPLGISPTCSTASATAVCGVGLGLGVGLATGRAVLWHAATNAIRRMKAGSRLTKAAL